METELSDLKENVLSLDNRVGTNEKNVSMLAMQLVDLENRNRRDNIRVRGVPETVKSADLLPMVTSIFNVYLKRDPGEYIEIDRLHRAPGRRQGNGERPRDIIVKMHYSATKEDIMRQARERGPQMIEGAEVLLLQDLSKKTLEMRRIVKPLLSLITSKGANYRWTFPFGLSVQRGGRLFVLKTYSQLGELFKFLDTTPIEIPDWLQILTSV